MSGPLTSLRVIEFSGIGARPGPLADPARHDTNPPAPRGRQHLSGRPHDPPVPPLNLVADFGGGSMFLIFGILAALFERSKSGHGQVVDTAMVDGVPAMMGKLHGMLARGVWSEQRGRNLLDGRAPFYRPYGTVAGHDISGGARRVRRVRTRIPSCGKAARRTRRSASGRRRVP